jgi:NAD(P)-dependent dehydrogenase (short-subunit alcohol dehydrogenase family)
MGGDGAGREHPTPGDGDGIGVTLIAPGRVATPFWDANGGPPAGGLLTADQIADAILWAISQPSGVDVNTVIVRPIGQPGRSRSHAEIMIYGCRTRAAQHEVATTSP